MSVQTKEPEAGESAAIPPPKRGRALPWIVGALGVVFAVLPFVDVPLPGVFSGDLSSPGTLQILAVALVFAGLAMSYDLLLGYTGMLSLGHALYFALGIYGSNMLMVYGGLPYFAAVPITLVGVAVVATVLGSVALRVRGVASAMVTLAFAEAFHVLVESDPLSVTGGEEGLPLSSDHIPDLFTGVVNLQWVYWLALLFALLTFVICRHAVSSRAGRVWQAVRENEDRVELLGLVPFGFKLLSFGMSATLAAAGGAVYLLVIRGANPEVGTAIFTLNVIIMVVLGGLGRLWGAALGGLLFGYLDHRLPDLQRAGVFDDLPPWLEGPLTEPMFILGVIFVALVMFAPGGIASLPARLGLDRVVGARRRRGHETGGA
ncbi:branched-chain amino acid ABC transporter permease [Egibacter rhizosphaerae]|uniref:Branched-chain amino acid ABC transporter permease n=1 Tax=Egibacter rhizosphaerae TaxID=1670831 RepID=A0A411YHG5_9ACTN|nr:branched-chain amino acid ABC transporter permease [Egibacter rhizosphaerae]QBI20704.1 branched-chain amino acid ABC transporter permease [Egibacter rhizosphaerae]